MNINIECGQRLKKCRLLSGYTQEALGNKANYKKETVCMFERGKRKLSVDAANNFAKVLHVRADYLLCRDDIIFPEECPEKLPDFLSCHGMPCGKRGIPDCSRCKFQARKYDLLLFLPPEK